MTLEEQGRLFAELVRMGTAARMEVPGAVGALSAVVSNQHALPFLGLLQRYDVPLRDVDDLAVGGLMLHQLLCQYQGIDFVSSIMAADLRAAGE